MRSQNSLADKFLLAAGCLYAATFILWYVSKGHRFFFPPSPEGTAHATETTWMPLLTAGWWDYVCIGMLLVASGFALSAFRRRPRDL